MTSLHEARVAEIDRRLADAEHAATERHAAVADAIRHPPQGDRLAAATAELDRYRAASGTGARPASDDLLRSIDKLRDATPAA
jgi:hypothetical protein